MSLLNTPRQIEMLGPVRNRWEGGVRGEGFLRLVKPVVRSGRKNWQKNILNNLLKEKTLLQLKSNEALVDAEEQSDSEESGITADRAGYHTYKSSAELISELAHAKPLSCVIQVNRDGQDVHCVYKRMGDSYVMRLVPSEGSAKFHWGMNYHYLQWENMDGDDHLELDEIHISLNGVLLPLLTAPGAPSDGRYTMVTSSWRIWDETGKNCAACPHQFLQLEVT